MAKDIKHDASCKTNDKPNSLVDVPCKESRKVTYKFVFRSKVSMPYAVSVDGQVLPAFKDRPKRTDSLIPVVLQEGQRVELYLNSDAHPAFRKEPVYKVVVNAHDVELTITEVAGKSLETDTPKEGNTIKNEVTGKSVQHMTAKLTGDIWMKISHKYSADEVDERIPSSTPPEVKSAIKSIYRELNSPILTIRRVAEAHLPARIISVNFADSNNPKENITNYSLLADGLPRVHPGGYAALLNAALESGIQSLTVSSCWRPMLGSIAHRAGLGLDVALIGGTRINRQELRRAVNASRAEPQGNKNDADNVSDAEVAAFAKYEQAIVENKKAGDDLEAATRALNKAHKAGDAANISAAKENLKKAQASADEAEKILDTTREDWNKERNAGEPNHVKSYRLSLLRCTCVKQLFDPWFMDMNTRDKAEPAPNLQQTSNETLHAHHLHITVDDPKIL